MNRPPRASPVRLLVTLGALFAIALLLVQFYLLLGSWLGSTLVGALSAHYLIGATFLVWSLGSGKFPSQWFDLPKPKCFLPGFAVLVGTIALSLSTRVSIEGAESTLVSGAALSILMVPLGEEVVFRGIIGSRLRQNLGPWTGAYLSALFFAWLHSLPTLEALASGQFGIFLGPFLLGIICEFLVIQSKGSLLAAISFHMICNASGPLFALIDGRWLKWLGMLYL